MSGPAYFATNLGNATFEGMEWDAEYTIDRGLVWADTIGGPPRAARLWAADGAYIHDAVDLGFSVWTDAAQAMPFEERMPGQSGILAPGLTFDLGLPGLSTNAALPGFGNFNSGVWVYRACTLLEPFEAFSRKGPRMDLWGYRCKTRFTALGNVAVGASPYNERGFVHPTGIQSVPAVLLRKFVAHQPQNYSRLAVPLPVNAPRVAAAWNGTRIDMRMSLDHLSSDEGDEVVTWFRGQRDTPFSLTSDQASGPGQPNTINVIARELTVNRGAGWWWDLKLDLTRV